MHTTANSSNGVGVLTVTWLCDRSERPLGTNVRIEMVKYSVKAMTQSLDKRESGALEQLLGPTIFKRIISVSGCDLSF